MKNLLNDKLASQLDELDDLNIEAALTLGECRIEQMTLTAKSIYLTMRRLAEQRKDSG